MADLKQLAQNASMLGGASLSFGVKNGAVIDSGMRHQFFADETEAYAEIYGPIASNVYDTECQGIDLADWYKYVPVRIRVQPAAQSTTGETMLDDWQRIHVIAPTTVTYIGQGAMLTFEGNTWIVYKPQNIGGVLGGAVVRRCNSVINVLDYYGNIVAIPMSFARMSTQGNAPQISENMILSKNYINCICQLNEYTSQFTENSRMILGKAAYAMRGLNDFTREFTQDADSAHLLSFTIERTEPLEQDSIELQCADYYSFSWELRVNVRQQMQEGTAQTIQVQSVRNGEQVAGSAEHPISYLFSSSNEEILSVDANGVVTAHEASDEPVTVTVTLDQNPEIQQEIVFTVSQAVPDYLAFTTSEVTELRELQSAELEAHWFSGGAATDETVTFTFSGAPESAYQIQTIAQNKIRVTAMAAATAPLTVTASARGQSVTRSIWLLA